MGWLCSICKRAARSFWPSLLGADRRLAQPALLLSHNQQDQGLELTFTLILMELKEGQELKQQSCVD